MNLTICIIEDDMVSQFSTRYIIQQINPNCRILVYYTAEEALKGLAEHHLEHKSFPDIILLDLNLPRMDGWEFLGKLKNLPGSLSKTAIYILSAFAISKDRAKAKEHPLISGYYDKPLTGIVAREIIRSYKSED